MLEDGPEDLPRDIWDLIELDFSELDGEELIRVRNYHESRATLAPAPPHVPYTATQVREDIAAGVTNPVPLEDFPDDLGEALGRIFPPENVLDFTGEVDGGGIKMSMYDDFTTKPPMELVPQALTRGCARALGYGANKYAPNNWRRGMRWGEVFGGLQRHLTAWNEGEDMDPTDTDPAGSGLGHLDHAAACLSFLMHMVGDPRYKEFDDRP